MAASFLAIVLILLNINPYVDNIWIFGFWSLIGVEIFGVLTYAQFWWFFVHKGDSIYTNRINDMLYRSLILSALFVHCLILWQINRANYLDLGIPAVLAFTYLIFSQS